MVAILIIFLFGASAVLAIACLNDGLRRYGPSFLKLRQELRACPEWREVRIIVREITVHPAGATILRPEFGPRDVNGTRRRPAVGHALPAAA